MLIEKTAFALREGEVSQPIEMPDKTAVLLMCERQFSRDRTRRCCIPVSKSLLYNDVMEVRVNQGIPAKLQELLPRFLTRRF